MCSPQSPARVPVALARLVLGPTGSLTREMLSCSTGRVSFEQLMPGESPDQLKFGSSWKPESLAKFNFFFLQRKISEGMFKNKLK